MKRFFKYIIISVLVIISFSQGFVYAADNNTCTKVQLGGEAFGIKMFSQGLIVIRTSSFRSENSEVSPAEESGIKANDIIISVNNNSIYDSSEFKKIVEESKGNEINIKLKRNNKEIKTKLYAKKDSTGQYRAGMWIKDSAAGLGTITFYCDETNSFCGLGHGICEADTGALIPIHYGEAEEACITSVTHSQSGKVGTLNGYFTGDKIGTILENNNQGIYGITEAKKNETKIIEIAKKEEVKKGDAYIYTTINSEEPKPYKIRITKIKYNDSEINMTIKITDEELLNETGGIVQGMSGSPIIQNEKLVGAVTHVLVEDVDMGYGIFAETMYENMLDVCRE